MSLTKFLPEEEYELRTILTLFKHITGHEIYDLSKVYCGDVNGYSHFVACKGGYLTNLRI